MKDRERLNRTGKRRGGRGLPLFLLGCFLLLALPFLLPRGEELLPGGLPFPESRIIGLEGTSIHYRVFPAEGELKGQVFLLHGLGGSTFSWRETVPTLTRAGYRVLAADLPGFGYSDRKAGLDHSQEARGALMWKLLNQEGLPGLGWILGGHSMGGGTVAAMAMSRPDQVEGLFMADGVVRESSAGFLGKLLAFPPFFRWGEVILARSIGEGNIRNLLEGAYGQVPDGNAVGGYLRPLEFQGTAASLLEMSRTMRQPSPIPLEDGAYPLLYIRGAEDEWVGPEEGETLKKLRPDGLFAEIPGAGHCPMETHPEAFGSILLQWLAESVGNSTVESMKL